MELDPIVARFKAGDRAAFDVLVRECTPMMWAATRGLFAPGLTREDLLQEARLGLFKAARDYNGTGHFVAFAKMCAERSAWTAVKSALRHKHQPLNDAVSMDKPNPDGSEDTALIPALHADPEARVLDRERLEALIQSMRWDLSPLEAKSLWMVEAEGIPYAEVGRILERSEKAIDNAVQRARRKLEVVFAGSRCAGCGHPIDVGVRCASCATDFEAGRAFLAAA